MERLMKMLKSRPFDKPVYVYVDMDGVLAKWNEFATWEQVSSPGYFISRTPEECSLP